MPRLSDTTYLAFPFRIDGSAGPATAARAEHVRGQIEQTLFTAPGERVFRQEFGTGARRLVFEPYSDALAALTRKQLASSLASVLRGEVDPRTLSVEVNPGPASRTADGSLELTVSYKLATINREEQHTFTGGSRG